MTVDQLSNQYLHELLSREDVRKASQIHFVTHSLGGIIVRKYLVDHEIKNLGRVVMLAPPNHGSEIIDWLRSKWITRNFLGAAARQLGTGTNDVPVKLGPIRFECGVIAGDRSLNPILSLILPSENDGKVTVASTRVAGMRDFLVLHATHTWMTCRSGVLNQSLCFLQSGHFSPNN